MPAEYAAAKSEIAAEERSTQLRTTASLNLVREKDVKTISTALQIYAAEKARLPAAKDDELKAGAFGLVGEFLQAPFVYKTTLDAYCYGYSPDGAKGFIAAWLAVEERPAVEFIDVTDSEQSKLTAALQASGGFMQGVNCPAVSGFATVRF